MYIIKYHRKSKFQMQCHRVVVVVVVVRLVALYGAFCDIVPFSEVQGTRAECH